MGYFQVRYDSRVVNYYRRGFIRLATGGIITLFIWRHRVGDMYSSILPQCVDVEK